MRAPLRRVNTQGDQMADTNGVSCTLNVPARRQVLLAGALTVGGFALLEAMSAAARGTRDVNGISRSAAAIHQEPVFAANRKRRYEALTDAGQFDKVIQLSGVSRGAKSSVPTAISTTAGRRICAVRRLHHRPAAGTSATAADRASVAGRQLGRGAVFDRTLSAGGS